MLFTIYFFWMLFLQIAPWLPSWIPLVFVQGYNASCMFMVLGLKDTIIGICFRRELFSVFPQTKSSQHPSIPGYWFDFISSLRIGTGVFEILKTFWVKMTSCLHIFIHYLKVKIKWIIHIIFLIKIKIAGEIVLYKREKSCYKSCSPGMIWTIKK